MNKIRQGQDGFALLVAMGTLVMVGAAAIVGPKVMKDVSGQRQDREMSLKELTVAQDALIEYVARNKRLPCPANATLAASNASVGVPVAHDAVTFRCQLPNNLDASTGAVPWRELGLSPQQALDRWGRKIGYRVYDLDPSVSLVRDAGLDLSGCIRPAGMNLTEARSAYVPKSPPTVPAGQKGPSKYVSALVAETAPPNDGLTDAPIHVPNASATDLCRRFDRQLTGLVTNTGLTIRESSNAGSAAFLDPFIGTGAAFILITHGENGRGAFLPSGQRHLAAQSAAELANLRANLTAAPNSFVASPFSGSTGNNAYDDIVIGMTITDLAVAASLGPAQDACSNGYSSLNECANVFGSPGGSGAGEVKILTADGQAAVGADGKPVAGSKAKPIVINFGKLDANQDGVADSGGTDPSLGNSVVVSYGKNACIWDTIVRDLDNVDEFETPAVRRNSVLRAYWEFRMYGISGEKSADGYVLGVVPNATFSRHAVPCGNTQTFVGFDAYGNLKPGGNDGTDLGWVGSTQLDPKTFTINPPSTFLGPKMGVEFDRWFSDYNYRNDAITIPSDSANLTNQRNHVAVLRENSTVHGIRPPCKDGTYKSIIGLPYYASIQQIFGALYGCSNDYSVMSANWTAAGLLPDMSNYNQVLQWVDPNNTTRTNPPYTIAHDPAKAKLFRTNPPCDTVSTIPGQIGCTYTNSAIWMEDRMYSNADPGIPYRVRLEVSRKCDSSCGQCGLDSGTNVLFKAWVDCNSNRCANLTRPLPPEFNDAARTDLATNRISYCMKDPGLDVPGIADSLSASTNLFGAAAFDRVRVGYTFATGGANSGMQVTNYKAGVFSGPLAVTPIN